MVEIRNHEEVTDERDESQKTIEDCEELHETIVHVSPAPPVLLDVLQTAPDGRRDPVLVQCSLSTHTHTHRCTCTDEFINPTDRREGKDGCILSEENQKTKQLKKTKGRLRLSR